MRYRLIVVSSLALGCAGCVTGLSQSGAFNEDWQRELTQYAPKKAEPEGIVLGEEKGPLRTRIYLDEKGKPRMELGHGAKMSIDLRVDEDDVKAGLKYKVPFGKRRPALPPPARRANGDEGKAPGDAPK